MSYSLPPEWAPQSGVMLTWPNVNNDWYPSLHEVEKSFVAIAKAISQEEKVLIACLSNEHVQHVRETLQTAGVAMPSVSLYAVPEKTKKCVRGLG